MDVDTSSYPKPQQSNFLDTASKLQQLEQQKIGIDTSKLHLINEQWGIAKRELSTLASKPDVNANDVAASLNNLVKLKIVPPDMSAQFLKTMPTQSGPQLQDWIKQKILSGQSNADAVNFHYGPPPVMQNNNQQQIPMQFGQNPAIGVKRLDTGARNQPIQNQEPPTQVEVDTSPTLPDGSPNPNYNGKRFRGPQPEQPVPSRGPLPVGPINNSVINGPSVNFDGKVTGATVENLPVVGNPASQVQNRFPGPIGGAASLPPGVGEAATATGAASGTQLAKARDTAANFQREIFPLAQAIPLLEKLGTKGTGPGTETLNHMKSFLLSNIPGLSERDPGFASVPTYDKAKKYLVDVVNQSGNIGTNDKLAATFAGNPSVNISNAATVDVAKSLLALKRMQQAAYLEFENKGLPDHQFSKWMARRVNEIDPRAFGTDMMSDDAKKKLLDKLNKDPVEKQRFEASAKLGVSLGFITPK
jgi:hypothetical protein